MSEAPDPESTRRLAVYSYLRPLVEGRRVLELGCGTGDGAAHLLALGARAVVGADDDGAALAAAVARHGGTPGISFVPVSAGLRDGGLFDLVLVPRAIPLLRGGAPLSIGGVRSLLGGRGRLACLVGSADRQGGGEGLGYYDVLDTLSPHFPRVRMYGQTPFAAFGLAEFDDAVGGLRVDSGLVDEASEQPVSYLAVAGPDDQIALGYALVQIPQAGLGAVAAPVQAPALEAVVATAELTRKLAEAQGQIDGGIRVARAQVEEIEELRARLRRAADDRARLDEEVARVRRALAEADESVMSLTRRSTEEMAALAQKLTAGLRPAEAPAISPAVNERMTALQAALADRESALSERDERIAVLEAERQDLVWRLEAAEDELRSSGQLPVVPASDDELQARLHARDEALDEYRRAAGAHMDEALRLRDALTEQSAAVAELEESLTEAQERLETAEQDSARLRRLAAETEEADRQRRSRLAELEGTLLRLQRQAALQAEPRPPSDDEGRRLAELERQLYAVRDRLGEAERQRDQALGQRQESERQREEAERQRQEAERRLGLAERWRQETEGRLAELERHRQEAEQQREEVGRLRPELDRLRAEAEQARTRADEAAAEVTARASALDRVSAERDALAHTEEALRARITDLTNLAARADTGRLESALSEVDRLRGALERSEEQLWEARGRLMADRERLEALERTLESGAGVSASAETQALIATVLAELAALETGLRAEAAQLAAVERALGEWRTALTSDSASPSSDRAPPAGES
jgi:SAM-dependent methyltransferase